MFHTLRPRCLALLTVLFIPALPADTVVAADAPSWKAGVAKAVITPQEPLWMGGYGGRTAPADGKFHDLWIRVVALEAADGQRAVILSSDTLGLSQPIYRDVLAAVERRYRLPAAAIMLNASHTHCGPVLKNALYDTYPLEPKHIEAIERYSAWLTDMIVETIGKALTDLQPATLAEYRGAADFAVNRRANREPDVPMLRERNALLGPVDHTVPVLAVSTVKGELKALVFAYACHNTVLSFQQWCGDYAGFAQYVLEERHPGCAALFVMGCGADQNPLPRRTVELAQKYGTQLADAVDAAMKSPSRPVRPTLQTAIEHVPLAFGPLPGLDVLEQRAATPANYQQRWSARMAALVKSGADIPQTYPYPVQAWKLGADLLWVTLGGEVVVDYSLKIRAEYGEQAWVTAYANDVMAYIPSLRVLKEGGYEGQSSMFVYGQPAERWSDEVETQVMGGVRRVVDQVQ